MPDRLFVGIVGGLWMLDREKFDAVKETGNEIGANLAAAGLGLVVYFSDERSLEPHVVTGYVKALRPGEGVGSIRVRYARSQRGTVTFAEQAVRKDVFELNLFPSEDWEAPFYRSLAAAEGVDAVLLMGGKRSTLIAAQIALARKLPILAIDKFDGAAGIIRSELATSDASYPSAETHTTTEMVAWLKSKCDAWEKGRAQAAARELRFQRVVSQRQRVVWAAGAFFVLIIIFFFGLGEPPAPSLYSFLTLAGLIAAGATGALVRSIVWGADETPPATSLLLGSIAGFAAGLAYLIPQYVGKYGVLDPAATGVAATDKIQFVSAVLVGVSAGIGFDTVFTRLKKQAESEPLDAPAKRTP